MTTTRSSLLGRASAAPLLLALSLTSARAAAQEHPGFAVDRFEPAERGSQHFVNDSLDLRGELRPAYGATLDYGHKGIVVYDGANNELGALVRHQLFAHLGGSLIVGDRVRFGLSVPVALYQDGEPAALRGEHFGAPDSPAFGDIRVAADARLYGEHGSKFRVAAGLRAWLPTGSRSQYTSDGSIRIGPQVMAAGDLGTFAWAARLALVYRDRDEAFGGSPLGSDLTGSLGGGLKTLKGKLIIGPELFASTVFTDERSFFKERGTPTDWLFGLHYDVTNDLRAGAGVGGGLTQGYGSPQLRALLSFEYVPAYQKPDRDHDGVFDVDDACPESAGAPNPDPTKNGCPVIATPPPPDADGDGITDAEDACPEEPGPRNKKVSFNGCPDRDKDGVPDTADACPDVAGVEDDDPQKNGCPPDRDGDGIFDVDDACPDTRGVKSEDLARNGCPADQDNDGIPDVEDACVDLAGPRHPNPKYNGCPIVEVTDKAIRIRQEIRFKVDSAELLPESDEILDAVKQVLDAHPEIKKVRVEGHTDNIGDANRNKFLSERRAISVTTWLVKRGIDTKRLVARGFGDEQPIDSNDTAAGRANNRRVAFTILEQSAPAPKEPAPAPVSPAPAPAPPAP